MGEGGVRPSRQHMEENGGPTVAAETMGDQQQDPVTVAPGQAARGWGFHGQGKEMGADMWARGYCAVVKTNSNSNSNKFKFNSNRFKL
jgi:hypothetical protein